MHLLLLLILIGLMHSARTFSPQPGLGTGPGGTTLACGFLLLTALLTGSICKRIGLPRLTGYLAAGLILGPTVLGLVSEGMVVNLRVFNGVAIALIALTAGTEIEFRTMRPLFRTIAWISVIAIVGTICVLAGTVYMLSGLLPFLFTLTPLQTAAISTVLAVTMAAQSPAVVVALRKETESDGPLTRTVLGVVVLSDLLVILLFAAVSSLAKAVLGGDANVSATAAALSWEILGSGVAGILIGILVAAFLRTIQGGGALFVVAVGFVVAEVGQRIQLDPLLVALMAGMFIRNLTTVGDRLHSEIEAASLPVYVAFFAVAGATIHLGALMIVGVPAAIFVAVRAAGFLAGSAIAARIAGSPEAVRRYAGFGLLPQAGLALALALLFSRTFPDFGPEASALVFGVVAINELVAPILYRLALVRSGEAGRGQKDPETAPSLRPGYETTG